MMNNTAGRSSLNICTPRLASAMQPLVDRRNIAGAVMLIATKDKVLALETIGFADIAAHTPMAADTLFWIASMTKPITAIALMMLVEEKKMRLDDPVQKYLPEFNPRILRVNVKGTGVGVEQPQQAVTVRHLLAHRSGLPAESSIETPTLDALPLALRVQAYALAPLSFEPGSRAVYSNAGISTAGRIIEVVGGLSYEAFLQQRVFDPLGMKDTTFWPTEAQLGRLAKSYRPDAARQDLEETQIALLRYPLTDRAQRYAVPAAGLFSTASDLARFCQMLLNGGIAGGQPFISRASIAQMSHNQGGPGAPGYEGWGLGWQIRCTDVYGHSGAYNTRMIIDQAHGVINVLLTQQAPSDDDPRDIIRATFDQAVAELGS